jgi:hypothetical protein
MISEMENMNIEEKMPQLEPKSDIYEVLNAWKQEQNSEIDTNKVVSQLRQVLKPPADSSITDSELLTRLHKIGSEELWNRLKNIDSTTWQTIEPVYALKRSLFLGSPLLHISKKNG